MINALIASLFFLGTYVLIFTKKNKKVLITTLAALVLILFNIFNVSSESGAFLERHFDVVGFIVSIMILIGIIRESGIFEVCAIHLVKATKGNARLLMITLSLLAFIMTILISNIPTILILIPILLILVKQLKLPYFPFLFSTLVMANIAGATTPISDPTTYYEASRAGLNFYEVLINSGSLVMILGVFNLGYLYLIFRKELNNITIDSETIKEYNPRLAIKDKNLLKLSFALLIFIILFILFKDSLSLAYKININTSIVFLFVGFVSIYFFNIPLKKVFYEYIDWETLLFFLGLLVITGSLDSTGVIDGLGKTILNVTHDNLGLLIIVITFSSALVSCFIDNIPYNIMAVNFILALQKNIFVYPLWWALNLGTSIGGFGSLISGACNIVALQQIERENLPISFRKYFYKSIPLVLLNCLIVSGILFIQYY